MTPPDNTKEPTNPDIEKMVLNSRRAYEAAQHVIDSMQLGQRIQIKDLAKDVGLVLALDPKEVLGFVNHFAHHSSVAYVTRGKKGGVIKGVRPAKVVKVAKVKKVKAPPAAVVTAGDFVCDIT
jgi:hypothetical protein